MGRRATGPSLGDNTSQPLSQLAICLTDTSTPKDHMHATQKLTATADWASLRSILFAKNRIGIFCLLMSEMINVRTYVSIYMNSCTLKGVELHTKVWSADCHSDHCHTRHGLSHYIKNYSEVCTRLRKKCSVQLRQTNLNDLARDPTLPWPQPCATCQHCREQRLLPQLLCTRKTSQENTYTVLCTYMYVRTVCCCVQAVCV